ncbi:hypothetical protein SERLA73DRAFT_166724 [Serpula lacrymans var. lacrymans S7.3]|uniref:Ras-GAP domain-containing protein n=2 Tax=Serpula lacrymans var. lacrymans TaxID=341189 RepID=F8PQK3_SERL3|nr:uncharacterized protein SERLADRAFT_447196 [Serpula lacrymans var. lacrymans S7.9]EGO02251.1 hypothetical protein SERLA73DRAFT_166724 [Serpula lacrymans var. lacrymans S7.3]EGO27971.1 hypothetical protein SERLADRAFT_447196 [Serpula lacrymans var. lacrymans S7.9]
MPIRRPSASAGHANPPTNLPKSHRSNDSHHAFVGPSQPPSIAYSAASATPQQKIVQALINRIKNKLPCNSGLALDIVESDGATQRAVEALVELAHDSLDIISWSLSELLERLAKQTDADGHLTVEVLQSQLFILKILSVSMASRWNLRQDDNPRSSSRASKGGSSHTAIEAPVPLMYANNNQSKRSRQAPSEYSCSTPPPWAEPFPLDDNCARYILSVMVLYLRQTAPPESRLMSSSNLAPDASLHDFESVDLPTTSRAFDEYTGMRGPPLPAHISEAPKPVLRLKSSTSSFQSASASMNPGFPGLGRTFQFEKTHMTLVKSTLSLNVLIGKFAGRIVYHLSASNWMVVFYRIRTKIHFLANTAEDNPDTIDLLLMTHSALDRTRLVQVLHELSSLLVNMKREAQAAVAMPLRVGMWNWVDLFPQEFNDAMRSRGRLEGAPERVFDLLYAANVPGMERAIWPTLTILNCLSSERMTADLQDARFVEDLVKHANNGSKLTDVSFVCAIDICRAGYRLSPEGDLPLRALAADIAHEVKVSLLKSAKQRPFWDSYEEIDVATYAEALAATFRFLSEEESIPIFLASLEPERSDAVKICAVKAATTLTTEASRLPWQPSLERLQASIANRLRAIYKTSSLRRSEIDQYGNVKRAAARPKAKRFTSETLVEKDLLLLAILTLWRADPNYYITHIGQAEIDDLMPAAAKIWESPVDTAVKISAATSFQHMTDIFFKMHPTDAFYDTIQAWLKSSIASTLTSTVKKLLLSRIEPEAQRLWISIAHEIIETYHRKSEGDHARGLQLSEDRVSAFAMAEIAFLVSLTSTSNDVSQLAAQSLRLIAQAERQPGAPVNRGLTEEDRSKRNPIYEQLGDPSVVVVGRVGQQRRVRKLLRLVSYPSPINVAVWQECYFRWSALSEFVVQSPIAAIAASNDAHLSPDEKNISQEEKFYQWRNLTLFLAAFGGACVQEEHDVSSLTSVIPPEFLPDEMRALPDPSYLVTSFIEFLTNELIDDDLRIREVAREALGSELSPRLFAKLFKHLDEITRNITEGAGLEFKEEYSLFLDQLISVLKSLVDNAQMPPDEALSIDLGSILHVLVGFISRFHDPASYRIRIKFCALCDSICDRTDTLTLRKDDLARNRILDIVMEWLQDPATIQFDLNLASLRTAVKLLDHLKLQPIDSSANESDDTGHAVSRLFIRYSHILMKALDICQADVTVSDSVSDVPSLQKKIMASQREADVRDLVIAGLSNLVSANSENGFKHCIALAYESDMRKRTMFVHVFARVLGQGAKFEPQGNAELQARRNHLCELVKGSDMILALVICECCPASEVDIMISVLMNLFDTRTSLMALLKTMIDREIAHTDNETALFRSNSTCTRFLSAFAKIHGYSYLRSLIIPLIKTMTSMPPGHGYELDPAKAGEQDVKQNQHNVEIVASSFLEIITSSVPALPPMFREVCAHLAKSVNQVWPDAKFAALGAFIFLRFISPAIVAPEIVDVEVPKGDAGMVIRRGLMVIAKVMQNLANNIFFGKEAHMMGLNDFLKANIVNVTRYLSEVNKYSAATADEESDEWLGTTTDDSDTIVLHRFLDKHADKIGKELLSWIKPSAEDDTASISAKRAWENLCATLVELQNAPEVPKLSPYASYEHRDYLDLMNRCAHRNIDAVRDIFVEAFMDPSSNAPVIFVLRVCKIDVEALDIELLMYHALKTLNSPQYENRHYEIILDCTSFTSTSEIPVQWLKICTELIPSDIRNRFTYAYILNPNQLTQRYLRRMYNVSAGTTLSSGIKACSSVAELLEHVPDSCMSALEYPTNLEDEVRSPFADVNLRQTPQLRMPVVMEVGLTHIRITSVRAQVISHSLSCRSTEIISLADVSDAYNVSTGRDPHEFIIRRSRQGVTSYFSSPARDVIVKTIRAAKSQLRDIQHPGTERFPMFTNISATLLHVGMINIGSEEEELRGAAYNLLGAVCSYLDYEKNPIIASKAGIIPGDISTFVISLSDRLANFAPKLTLDFMSVISAGMDKATPAQRINCLQYMSPWVRNLAMFCNPSNALYEHSGARLRDCIRSLIDLTISDLEISSMIHKYIWVQIGNLDTTVVNIVLDELIRAATDGGIGSRRCETIARTAAALSSVNVRGRIFTKLRKVLGKTSLKPSRTLAENQHWNEIATLARFALVASNHSKQAQYDQLYLPDICHVVTLVAGTGQTLIRKSVYGIIMNFLQSLFLARADDATGPDLRVLIDELTRLENLQLFGLGRQSTTSEYTNYDPQNDKVCIDNQEGLTHLLLRIMEVTAGSKELLNVWRARWMSLATSTAFQLPAAIQSRAYIVLGTLATSDVDDDLVYQMLVAFKSALLQPSEMDTMTVVSMLRCICKVVPSLAEGSRYLPQLFWLAVALLQSSYTAFYAEAAELLRATLETLESHDAFEGGSISSVLLESRSPLEETISQLDRIFFLSFDVNFSFSLSATIFKGIRHSHLRSSAETVLRSLLSVTVRSYENAVDGPITSLCPDALGYFIALIPFSTTRASYVRLLKESRLDEFLPTSGPMEDDFVPRISIDLLPVNDGTLALFLVSFIGAMLTTAQGDDAETEILYHLLSDVGCLYPDLLSMSYENLQDRIKDTFALSSNPAIIRAVSSIFRVAQSDPLRLGPLRSGSMSTLTAVDENNLSQRLTKRLDELGMQGLATSFQFLSPNHGQWPNISGWISELVMKIVGLEVT